MPLIAQLSGDDANDGSSDRSKTFVFTDEGHTLGNILKSILCRYEDVQFCGYTVPHPAEQIMHLRIQAGPGVRAIDVLQRALGDLHSVCDHVIDTFEVAVQEQAAAVPVTASS